MYICTVKNQDLYTVGVTEIYACGDMSFKNCKSSAQEAHNLDLWTAHSVYFNKKGGSIFAITLFFLYIKNISQLHHAQKAHRSGRCCPDRHRLKRSRGPARN